MILVGNVIEKLSEIRETVQTCVTSPPYWGLRDYGVEGQLGLEKTPQEFVANMVEVFRGVRRVLRDDGTLWLNIGDSYASQRGGTHQPAETLAGGVGGKTESGARVNRSRHDGYNPSRNASAFGLKHKDLCLIPERLAIALQDDGWWIRSRIAWCKKSSMPESVTDRPTSAWEHLWLLTKSPKYFYDAEAVKQPHAEKTLTHRGNGRMAGKEGRQDDLGKVASGNWADDSPRVIDPTGANLRNYWVLGPEPLNSAVVYGSYRIASANCRVHDCQAYLEHALRGGELQVSSGPAHSLGIDARPDQGQEGVAYAIREDQYGFLSDVSFATSHSNEIRRMADQLARRGTSDDKSSPHTECISESHHSSATSDHTPESNTSGGDASDGTATCPSAQTHDHILGIATFEPPPDGCTCKYRGKVEKRQDHYAAFPSEIPRRCIKAGTSQKGACSECGAPWERVTDREPSQYAQGMTTRTHRDDTQPGNVGNTRNENGIVPYLKPVQATTTGWQPTCDCDAEVVPCTVLDPFLGSGTTAAVAQELDREWVGIELNPEYAALAEKRIASVGAPQIGLSI